MLSETNHGTHSTYDGRSWKQNQGGFSFKLHFQDLLYVFLHRHQSVECVLSIHTNYMYFCIQVEEISLICLKASDLILEEQAILQCVRETCTTQIKMVPLDLQLAVKKNRNACFRWEWRSHVESIYKLKEPLII